MARAAQIQETDELPEIDRLDGFPHPRMTERLYGHEAAEEALAEAVQGGRMHHGWLVAGAEGIGKATLAYRLARYLLAQPSERAAGVLDVAAETQASRQVRALSHPGLLVIRRNYDVKGKRFPQSISVEEVRKLKAFLGRTSLEGQWRVVIVDRADDLNINAANALLKSLEEPPPQTVFVLVSQHPGRLLPTIRSRVRLLELSPLAGEPLRRAVTQAFTASGDEVSVAPPSGSDWERLEALAGGSARRLISLHAQKGIQLFDRIEGLFRDLPRVDWGAVHTLSDDLQSPAAEQRFELFFELLLDHIARLIKRAAMGEAGARGLVQPDRLATWAELWERVAADKAEALALNLDRKALILDIFSKLETVQSGRV